MRFRRIVSLITPCTAVSCRNLRAIVWATFNTYSRWPLEMGVDRRLGYGIMCLTKRRRYAVPRSDPDDEKLKSLRQHHALNPRPQRVTDATFTRGNPFFDPRDLVQVKYEMLRSVSEEGRPATHAARDFGFSRPSFYQAQAVFEQGGLPALLPQRPGPKRAHKLTEEVVDFLESARAADPGLNPSRLAQLLQEEYGLSVHRRSIERALERRSKKDRRRRP